MGREDDSSVDARSSIARDTGNLFIDRLAVGPRRSLLPHLTRVSLKHGEIVYEPDAAMARVLFPIHSVVSVVTEMLDGSIIEVGFIGREGMTGLPIALGTDRVAQRALVQIPVAGWSISTADFEACLRAEPELRTWCLRYAQAVLASVSQFAACNKLHSVNERCARWLLMAHDRVPGDVIPLTHLFLSQMLGVRRAGVSVAAATLQAAGFIEYSNNGRIHIRNRLALESASCECYAVVERQWEQIFGYSVRKTVSDGRAASREIESA
jgi:CRP-like cAMP-binding protein